jgi:hypothetical protein
MWHLNLLLLSSLRCGHTERYVRYVRYTNRKISHFIKNVTGHTEPYLRHTRYVRYVCYTNRKISNFIHNMTGHTERYVRHTRYVRNSVWPVTLSIKGDIFLFV